MHCKLRVTREAQLLLLKETAERVLSSAGQNVSGTELLKSVWAGGGGLEFLSSSVLIYVVENDRVARHRHKHHLFLPLLLLLPV